MEAILYKATNLVNGNIYLGVTTRFCHRKVQHFCAAKRGVPGRFYNAVRKYGRDAFWFSVVKLSPTLAEALEEEKRLIALWKPTYNITIGGEGRAGFKMPREVVRRLGAMRRGKPAHNRGSTHTEETKIKLRAWRAAHPDFNPRLGKKSPGSGLKAIATKKARGTYFDLGAWARGRPQSPEAKAKFIAKRRGIPRGPRPAHAMAIFADNMRRAAAARRKPVIWLDTGLIFDSARAAERQFGFSDGAVAAVASGARAEIHGKRFCYEDAK